MELIDMEDWLMGGFEKRLEEGYASDRPEVFKDWGTPAVSAPDKLEPKTVPCMACEMDVTQTEFAIANHRKAHAQVSEERVAAIVYEMLGEDLTKAEHKPRRITDEAEELVYGDRQAAYGHPASDFTAMGRISAAILSRWIESEGYAIIRQDNAPASYTAPVYLPDVPPRIVALMMTAVKLSRESAQPKKDNRVDLIGYVLCEDRIVNGETS
jgi:hypothetical protein